MAPVVLPGEQRAEVLHLDRCAAFPVPSRLLGREGSRCRLLQDWPAHSGLLCLGFSHIHCPISLTAEPGPHIRSSHLFDQGHTFHSSTIFSYWCTLPCHITVFPVAARRDLAEEKEMMIPGRMSSAFAKAGGGRKCQKLLTDVYL